jgi:N-acetylglucosaminyldiphosphoundecaprenol N-acetyl-beta-D-mannosaminyltransferase
VYSDDNSDEIFEKIDDSWAQILFSTLGMKRQEISVLKWLNLCPKLRLGLWIGSSFDYHIGFQKRAPKIFRDLGFEWLYRIFTSPSKLQRLGRIFQALIIFPIKVVTYKK